MNTRDERTARGEQGWKAPTDSGFARAAGPVLLGLLAAAMWLVPGGLVVASAAAQREASRHLDAEARLTHDRLIASPAGPTLPVERTAHGRDLYMTACASCHAPDGTGLPGLGKDLTRSWFVASREDIDLATFIAFGRPVTHPLNTTRVAMPAKGGHEELSAADLGDLVLFLRGLQDGRRLPALPEMKLVVAPVSEADKAAALAAAGGDAELAGFIASGSKIFAATCAACHGKDARGIAKNGKPLIGSPLVSALGDEELLDFIRRGRDPGDPKNTTGVAMPPKGGNPALQDDDLLDVIAYIRSIQKPAPGR